MNPFVGRKLRSRGGLPSVTLQLQVITTYWVSESENLYSSLCMRACSVTKLCVCDPMDCGPPGSSVHGAFQARILEWVVISSSRGSSRPRDGTQASCHLHWQGDSLPLSHMIAASKVSDCEHTHVRWDTGTMIKVDVLFAISLHYLATESGLGQRVGCLFGVRLIKRMDSQVRLPGFSFHQPFTSHMALRNITELPRGSVSSPVECGC